MQSSVDLLFDIEQRTHQSPYVTYTYMTHRIEYKAYGFFASSIKLFLVRLHLLIFFLRILLCTSYYIIYVEIKGGAHLCTWVFRGNVTRGGVVARVAIYI
jgi:hypothetical protein